ncbi:hypothetical protein RvY_16622-2 [Ramazzottius varieornatus]|uniref:WD repeat protein 35 n=1 Tax=Ramazzottius varieornatus TaxID=947166 RepID=A0A1D1VZ51_RAMVA|nr:hypothetical protein RvY_16622-2 [Ramazzottius varieornatus]
MMWERESAAILPAPTKLGLNSNSSRLLCMNGEGQCCMYLLSESRMGKDDVLVKDVKIGVEKEGVWDFIWAHDDPDLFAVAHRHRAIIFRNREPEDPIVSDGYFCQFKNLELRIAHLDDLHRSAAPTDPTAQSTKLLRVKSLRQALHLLEAATLAEAQSFVSTHSHPVLWNLLADKALRKLEIDVAETCYVHGQNYRGLHFVQKLKKTKSDKVRQAEVSAHFGDLYRAEQEFMDANRTDLAYDMRRISGDWFRLNEMALEDQNDAMLKESYEGLGKYYFDRQLWDDAVKNFENARDYASLYKTRMMNGDTEKLQELAENLPAGHHLLVDIGSFLGRCGNSKVAAKILRKVERPDLAIKICLDNFDFRTAMEISRAYDLEDFPPAMIKATTIQTIKAQSASQDGGQALWDAANLYHNAGPFLESANCLFQVLVMEVADKETDVHRLRKISVLAASAVEEYNKTSSSSLLGKQVYHPDDSSTLDYIFLEAPWRSAEAYNLLIVAQVFYDQGEFSKALRAAGTLCLYQDILDPVQIFSLIALASVQLKRWDVVNEAIIRVVHMDSTDSKVAEDIERFADDLFTKHSPKDVDLDSPLPTPLCLNCKERISLWDIRCQGCGTKYPLCMATGTPITEKEVWQCQFCHHHSAASVALQRKTCALCHSPG